MDDSILAGSMMDALSILEELVPQLINHSKCEQFSLNADFSITNEPIV